MKHIQIAFAVLTASILSFSSCSSVNKIYTPTSSITDTLDYTDGDKQAIQIDFYKGKAFNHPSFAVWVEDLEGKHIKTLFVTKSIATGVFGNAQLSDTTWSNKPGKAYRPAALPYWFHKKGELSKGGLIPSPNNEYTDAVSGATPKSDFIAKMKQPEGLPNRFVLLIEINQTWDWNNYWNNSKHLGDINYQSSAQPSVVYAVVVDRAADNSNLYMNPIGHGHYNGSDGKLYTDLTNLTTALNIAYKIQVRLQ